MTERDLERVLNQSVQDVHLSDAARRRIRRATKEERPVTSKKFVAIVLAVMLTLTASVGIAEELGLFDFLARKMGQTVLPGANELVKNDVAYGETDHVTYTIKQALYDGQSASLLVEMKAKDEETFLLPDGWILEDGYGALTYSTEAEALADPRTIAEYAKENGYTRMVNPSVELSINSTSSGVDEWVDNTLTVLYSFSAEGDILTLPIEYFSCECSATERSNFQRVPDTITLKANTKPLWTVSSSESFDAPGFGVHVDGVTITGTPVQSYWTINYTVTDVETAYNLGWNFNLLDMDKEYLPRGVLGSGGSDLPTQNGQQLTYTGTFAAMEQPPEQLMILLRNWDNFDLNEYFPITLK